MLRAVADTNTVVSGLLWGGNPGAILTLATAGRIDLFTSPVLLDELEEVLSRPRFAARLELIGRSAAELSADFRAIATTVQPAPIEPVVRDPDDDHVLACAVGAGAEILVTRDRDLLALGTYRGVRILVAREAIALADPRP